MAHKILPEADYLRECFSYDPESGELRWKTRPRSHFTTDRGCAQTNSRFTDRLAATRGNAFGHASVCVGGRVFYAHRIIWKMARGTEPPEIDHQRGVFAGDKWTNLRAATRQQNTQNKKVRSDSKTGFKGVRRDERTGRFGADIMVNGKRLWLGTFVTAKAAHDAYCEAAKRHFGEFWNDGKHQAPA